MSAITNQCDDYHLTAEPHSNGDQGNSCSQLQASQDAMRVHREMLIETNSLPSKPARVFYRCCYARSLILVE